MRLTMMSCFLVTMMMTISMSYHGWIRGIVYMSILVVGSIFPS